MDAVPEPALARVLGLPASGRRAPTSSHACSGPRTAGHSGCGEPGELDGEGMRAEFVNLLRWRLEHDLAYRTTHALQV